jgi:hypothetical protein
MRTTSTIRLLAGLVLGTVLSFHSVSQAADEKDYSQAERLLFMTDQLANVKPPATLRYSFRKSGALEENFQDTVTVALRPAADGSCCATAGTFLTGARNMSMPDVDSASGNPVIMYFLEHDVRDMNRLTKGSQSYFRKMIRMAVYKGASVKNVKMKYQGRSVDGRQVSITPFLDDPNRPKYEKFVRKEYVFLLSDAVPGGVFGIHTTIKNEKVDAPPLVIEEMYIEGAEPGSAKASS